MTEAGSSVVNVNRRWEDELWSLLLIREKNPLHGQREIFCKLSWYFYITLAVKWVIFHIWHRKNTEVFCKWLTNKYCRRDGMWGTFRYMPPVISQACKAETGIRLMFDIINRAFKISMYCTRPACGNCQIHWAYFHIHSWLKERAEEHTELSNIKYSWVNIKGK